MLILKLKQNEFGIAVLKRNPGTVKTFNNNICLNI